MPVFKATGVILRRVDLGEGDRRLIALTREGGKIAIFARGARNAGSKFAAAQPFALAEFMLYDGGGFFSLNQIAPIMTLPKIADDYDRYCCACLFLEIADGLILPEMDGRAALEILLRSLRALDSGRNMAEVFAAFVFKFLQKEGVAPLLRNCPMCDAAPAPIFAAEGAVCGDCAPGAVGVPIKRATMAALAYILDADIPKMLNFRASADVVEGLAKAAKLFLCENTDVKFASLPLVDV